MSAKGGPPVVTDGLVLHLDAGNKKSYPGNGIIWTDLSRNGNNGTLTNGPTFNSSNRGSLIFDGADDYVSTPITAAVGTNEMSYNVWIKYTAASQNGSIISKRVGSPTYQQLSLYIAGDDKGLTNGSKIVFNDVQDLNFLRTGITTNSYNDGGWHNATVTRTSTTSTLFIDGAAAVVVTSVTLNLTTASKIFIGQFGNDQSVAGGTFNGSIANVQIYNRALTPAEVLQNYNATRGRFQL